MNNMGHSCCTRPPGCEPVMAGRELGTGEGRPDSLRPGASELFTSEVGVTVRREVEK